MAGLRLVYGGEDSRALALTFLAFPFGGEVGSFSDFLGSLSWPTSPLDVMNYNLVYSQASDSLSLRPISKPKCVF